MDSLPFHDEDEGDQDQTTTKQKRDSEPVKLSYKALQLNKFVSLFFSGPKNSLAFSIIRQWMSARPVQSGPNVIYYDHNNVVYYDIYEDM